MKMKTPPFLRAIDKFAFVCGIVLLMSTEYFVLQRPQQMHTFYTYLIVPLLLIRFFLYHRSKYHYFMLDYCYFCQLVCLVFLYLFPYNVYFFKLTFTLTTGPLASAVVAWRNSLVFHDLDKITSLFIHLAPPCVMFCYRWYPPNAELFQIAADATTISFKEILVVPVSFYVYWQAMYILKTEYLDQAKLKQDKELMTSSRWMSEIKPHTVYKFLVSKGFNYRPTTILAFFQLLYTIVTLIPMKFVYEYYEVHVIYLALIFATATWFGASYYFDVFSESYSKRLQTLINHKTKEGAAIGSAKDNVQSAANKIYPTCSSFVNFVGFFVLFIGCFFMLAYYLCSQ